MERAFTKAEVLQVVVQHADDSIGPFPGIDSLINEIVDLKVRKFCFFYLGIP